MHNGTELDIWASGSKWLDEKRTGNVFEKLALLRLEQFDADENGKARAIEECNNTKLQQKQTTLKSRQETDNEANNKLTALPEALNTDEAKSILQNAIDIGLCDTNYQWKKTKALLAYFADKTSEYLDLGKGEYDGKAKTSWKPFESLFGISGLSGAKRDYQKTGTLPVGYKDVDNLFG